MFVIIQAHEYQKYAFILDQMFRLRKKVFADILGWNVPVIGPFERDSYDSLCPAYLVWCDETRTRLYGGMRLMPTTGPTLLYDVFRATFPQAANLVAPGIWEGTRMCIDEEAIADDFPEVDAGRAFSMLLLALCECGWAQRQESSSILASWRRARPCFGSTAAIGRTTPSADTLNTLWLPILKTMG